MPESIASEVPITFETIYELLRRERGKEELQSLSQKFFSEVLAYLREKEAMYDQVRAKSDLFSLGERDKLQQQVSNIRRLLRELYDRRERKIIELALNKARTNSEMIDTGSLLPEEAPIFQGLSTVLSTNRDCVLGNILALRQPSFVPQAEASVVVQQPKRTMRMRFTQDVDKFVGRELEEYGPFSVEDTAYLPKDVAELLVERKLAVEVTEDD